MRYCHRMRFSIPAAILVLTIALTGCASEASPAETNAVESVPSEQLPLYGELVSQGSRTVGTVTLAASSDSEFTLTLSGFSTAPGDDLRLQLSPGELVKGEDGYYSIDDNTRIEVEGTVDPDEPEQSFTVPLMVLDAWQVRSFTIYDYANRVALGSAALSRG